MAKLRDSLPTFTQELERALRLLDLPALADQLDELTIVSRCPCDDPGCATFTVQSPRVLNAIERNIIGVRYARSVALDGMEGTVVVDVDNHGRVTSIEVMDRSDVGTQLATANIARRAG